MKLETRKEAIQAMLDGHTVIDADGDEWVFKGDVFNIVAGECISRSVPNAIKVPATIKEEPELLYEVATRECGEWELRGKLFKESEIEGKLIKTGRVFIEKDGKLELYRGE